MTDLETVTSNRWYWIVTLQYAGPNGPVVHTADGLIDVAPTRQEAVRAILAWVEPQLPPHAGPLSILFFSLEPNDIGQS